MSEFLSALISSGEYDVVVRGHTHSPEIRKEGRTLIINPGEICGYLTGKKTLCLLDPGSMDASLYEIGVELEASAGDKGDAVSVSQRGQR